MGKYKTRSTKRLKGVSLSELFLKCSSPGTERSSKIDRSLCTQHYTSYSFHCVCATMWHQKFLQFASQCYCMVSGFRDQLLFSNAMPIGLNHHTLLFGNIYIYIYNYFLLFVADDCTLYIILPVYRSNLYSTEKRSHPQFICRVSSPNAISSSESSLMENFLYFFKLLFTYHFYSFFYNDEFSHREILSIFTFLYLKYYIDQMVP